MDWIKKNPHLLALALLALLLLGASAVVIFGVQSFPAQFETVQTSVTPTEKVPPLDMAPLERARQALEKPVTWTAGAKQGGSLFVSELYLIDNNKPIRPAGGDGFYTDTLTTALTGVVTKIPNPWFLENNLPLLDPNVGRQDPDGDGFWNEDEFRAKTNPNDPKSHPPFYTKLFVKEFIRVPFRLKFQVYDGDPKKPEKMEFQINSLDLRQPSVFLKIGESIQGTGGAKFRIDKFEQKMQMNASTQAEEDVSELTLTNTQSNEQVVLILNKVTDSPDSYASFVYLHPKPPQDIRVRRFQEFVLRPELDKKYKLLDIKDAGALIQLPSGEQVSVPKLPPAYP